MVLEMITGMFKVLLTAKVAMRIMPTTVKTMTSTTIMTTLATVMVALCLDMSVGVEDTSTIIVANLI
jgi:hypothetical protein